MRQITACILFLLAALTASAQEKSMYRRSYPRTISLAAGASITGVLLAKEEVYTKKLKAYWPAIQARFDNQLKFGGQRFPHIEYGAIASLERIEKLNPGHIYYLNGNKITEDYRSLFLRMNVSAGMQYLWLRHRRWDCYSGLRLGMGYLYYENNSGDTTQGEYFTGDYKVQIGSFEINSFKANRLLFQGQVVLFGTRVFPLPRFGITAEISVGAPHLVSAGFCYRW